MTLSTSGVVPALKRLSEVSDVSLAVSLHAPNNKLRNQLVPINRKYPLEQLLDAIHYYMNRLTDSRRVVTISIRCLLVLMIGVNMHSSWLFC